MASSLNPYLHFDGDARAAMTFYQSLFGGDLQLMTYGDQGMEGAQAEQIMHAQLVAPNGLVLMGSDTPPGMTLTRGETVVLSLSGDDEAELRAWFDGLSAGGEVHVPLEKQMWGDVFGQCADSFGVIWMVNITGQS